MSAPGISAAAAVAAIKELGTTHAIVIPDSESRLLHQALLDEPGIAVITPCREGESVAIAAGLWVGGMRPLLVIQNTGLMEAGDAMRGCAVGPRVPLRMIVGWRGYAGATSGALPIDSAYTYTEPILSAWGIPYLPMMSDADLPRLAEMDRTAAETSLPAAVVTGYAFAP